MDRRKLVVALVGAIGLSLTISPAEAIVRGPVVSDAHVARLVVRPCHPLDGALTVAYRSLGSAVGLVGRSGFLHPVPVVVIHDVEVTAINTALLGSAVAVDDTWYADDVEVTAVNTGLGGSALAQAGTWYADDVEVTAVNTAPLGTAVAVVESRRARDIDVTAVNTAPLGTAVAVADNDPPPSRHSNADSDVTAINTGILGTAVAVGGGGSGDVTAINTGILGTAIAVGGGGPVGYPIGY